MRGLRRSPSRRLRILFATDLHGSEAVFRKFLNAVPVYEASIAILGGDLTGKRILPILARPGGWVASVGAGERRAANADELKALIRTIRDLGQYPIVVSEDELALLRDDAAAVEVRFADECHQQVSDWMARAAERLEPLGVPLFVTGGNDDYLSIEPLLDSAPYITNAEGRVVELAPGLEMISSGYGNPTPWKCPRDISEEELAGRIDEMAHRITESRRVIFNLHVPPYGSGLDVCPRLDTSVDPPKPMVGDEIAAGSTAVRAAIERYSPALSLHGHIHESRGIQRIGRTVCVNPGSEYGEGILRSAVIDVDLDSGDVRAQLLAA